MANGKSGDKGLRAIVIGMIVFVITVTGIFIYFDKKAVTNVTAPASISKADGSGLVFNPELTNQIDIWEDFQCPVCARFTQTNGDYIEKLIEEKKAKVVFHTLSFLGPESVLAANAAACSSDENKFLGFHKAFYANLPAENSGAVTADYLVALGQGV